jgi:hydrogenase nickel incorporation protein HypB
LINKVDLLPYLDLDLAQLRRNIAAVNPAARVLQISARTGEGLDEWCGWLRAQILAPGS